MKVKIVYSTSEGIEKGSTITERVWLGVDSSGAGDRPSVKSLNAVRLYIHIVRLISETIHYAVPKRYAETRKTLMRFIRFCSFFLPQ